MMSPVRAGLTITKSLCDTAELLYPSGALQRPARAALHVLERVTRRYEKPAFDIKHIKVGRQNVAIEERIILETAFCDLIHFRKVSFSQKQQKLLIVAPLSGHHATLLRETVRGLLPHFDVFITDWTDARDVPIWLGDFDLDDYIDRIITFFHTLGPSVTVLAVCQPSVPVLAAVALMAEDKDPCRPDAMILVGGPIDTRKSPTLVNSAAQEQGADWFRSQAIQLVPAPYVGFGRRVYPGFLQIAGFMTMNLDRHIDAHRELFEKLVEGCEQSVDKHDAFYEEYLSVLDLTESFFMQTVQKVFVDHDLPQGRFHHRDRLVRCEAISDVALMTIEGERDDISGLGQTEAAHRLCVSIPEGSRAHFVQEKVGHYGTFSGRRFKESIVPKITAFAHAASKSKEKAHDGH